MRFTPHRNPQLQYESAGPVSGYDSLTDTEDELEDLGEVLDTLDLKGRFDYVRKVCDYRDASHVSEVVDHTRESSVEWDDAEVATKDDFDPLHYFADMLSDRLAQSKKRVLHVIEAEEKRKRLEEERRREEERKRAEEERRRIEEEERRKKEEAEKKRQLELEQARKRMEEEEQRKKEDERRRKEAEEAEEAARKAEYGKTNYVAVEQQYLKYKQDIADIKRDVVEKMKEPANKELKKLVGVQKRKINPKFGQLTNSEPQWQRIMSQIHSLVTEAKSNELAYRWLLNFMAKAIISQAETEVTVKPDSAVPLAKLALNLLIVFPEFEYYLMARFVKKCPLVIGYTCTIDTEQGRQRMGWKRKADGKWEEDIQYDERLSGIATVYAVMCRLQIDATFLGCDAAQTKHPLPISRAWTMMSRLVNLPLNLATSVHFAVAGMWWDSCAAQICAAYGRQGAKLLRVTCADWTQAVAERKYSGAARLRLLGEDWQRGGELKQFKGMTSEDVPDS
ncbi:hypothetical protein KL937_005156 [Ogataea polymorpha]|nr:hypothetical protein KL937_005156 [Ogataea polymorpha]KAG7931280.1 hypothetical protein KL904_005155 [Ogataea polymorpha]